MKKLYTLLVAGLITAGAMAQSTSNFMLPSNMKMKQPASMPQKHYAPLATNQFVIDYDSADAAFYDPAYQRYFWDFNWHYAPTDSSLKFFTVAFDSLYDSYTPVGYSRNSVTSVRIDTVYMIMGQENNSGFDDTLITKLMNVTANGYPGATVLKADTTIISAGTPFGTNWLNAVLLSIPMSYVYTNNDQFCVKVEYHGNKLDTAGWIAGFGDHGACNSASVSANMTNYSPWKINASTFYTSNTFALYTQYTSSGTLPTATGGHLYYDCNGNSAYDAGTDGESYLENMSVYVMVTTDPLGIKENADLGVKLYQNMPNPFNGNTTIQYELTNNSVVSLSVYDIAGKEIMNFDEGKQSSGKHEIAINAASLQAGVYFYAITVNGNRLTNKMTVIK